MTGFPDILDQFPPRRVARHVQSWPDERLTGAQPPPWPALAGMVGVFFTSRSGSTALARLAERHFAVDQVGETLNAPLLEVMARRRSQDGLRAALVRRIATGSPQGWHLFKAGGAGVLNAARIGFFDEYGAMIRPILLLREDIVGQALSIFAAHVTGRYHSTQSAARPMSEADFDRHRIAAHVATIVRGNRMLTDILGHFAHPPALLLYESFAAGDEAGAVATLAAAGLPRRARIEANPARMVTRNTHPLTAQFRARFMDGLDPPTAQLIADHAAAIADWSAR